MLKSSTVSMTTFFTLSMFSRQETDRHPGAELDTTVTQQLTKLCFLLTSMCLPLIRKEAPWPSPVNTMIMTLTINQQQNNKFDHCGLQHRDASPHSKPLPTSVSLQPDWAWVTLSIILYCQAVSLSFLLKLLLAEQHVCQWKAEVYTVLIS